MSIPLNKSLSQNLSALTYNADNIQIPKDTHLNIFMGIGLWSVKNRLSEGLPVDIMYMLLSAAVLHSQIKKANPEKSPKVLILIADSMAIREGAASDQVTKIVQVYKKSLEPLLELLNIKASSEIIHSSEVESSEQYQESLQVVDSSPITQKLKEDDKQHQGYICAQTALTLYMNQHHDAGIKVGWLYEKSKSELRDSVTPQHLKYWDELKFDRWCQAIAQKCKMQYLYTKAGLSQSTYNGAMNVSEACPYTAYAKDQRYIVQTENPTEIKTICPIQKRVATHWKGIAQVCISLAQENILHPAILPKDCIRKSNEQGSVYNMLNYWSNAPIHHNKACDPVLVDLPLMEASCEKLTITENTSKLYSALPPLISN